MSPENSTSTSASWEMSLSLVPLEMTLPMRPQRLADNGLSSFLAGGVGAAASTVAAGAAFAAAASGVGAGGGGGAGVGVVSCMEAGVGPAGAATGGAGGGVSCA